MLSRRRDFCLGLVIGGGFVAASSFLVVPASGEDTRSIETLGRLRMFSQVFDEVRARYVERPNESKMLEGALSGMLSSLDPHSQWLDSKAWADMQVTTSGEFGGLGIEVQMDQGVLKVVSPIDDGPAQKAGLLSGDRIVRIGEEDVRGMSLSDAVARLRGQPGTTVSILVARPDREAFPVTMKREIIKPIMVKWRTEEDVGVIRISQFGGHVEENVRKAIADLTGKIPSDRLKGFVLDLRNNPGGLLDQAIAVTSAFSGDGKPVVSIKGRSPSDNKVFLSAGEDLTRGKPLVVLVNGGSASASEIVSGALQDNKRATILGSRTFGKASVQTILPFGDGAIRITTARYYTPSGRSIQAKGITPDKVVLNEVPDALKGKDEVRGEASLPGHLANSGEDSSASSSFVPEDPGLDAQFQAALTILRTPSP